MRDIRSDLRERAEFLNEQINAAKAEFEQRLRELKRQHDNRLRDIKATFDAVSTLLEVEQRRLRNSQPVGQSQKAPPQGAPPQPGQPDEAQPGPRLLPILIRKLSDEGPASSDDLRRWAVQEGYLDDSAAAASALYNALAETAEAGFIQQLPDGTFAAARITDLIKLQRTV